MRRITKKLDTPRRRTLQDDEQERIYKTMVLIDQALTDMAEASGLERFWGILNEASFELFNHIEKAYEQQDRPTMQRLCDLLEDWVVRFQPGGVILSMLFLAKALLHSEIDIEDAAKYIRKAKHVIEDLPDQHFLSRVMLLQGDMYIGKDPKKAATCFVKCVGFCEKNAVFYSREEHTQILEEMRACLLTAYYKLAMLERANDDEQPTVMGYLQEACKQAFDLFGQESAITRRLEQHCMQESARSRQDEFGTNRGESTARNRINVYQGTIEVDSTLGLRKFSDVCIVYDTEQRQLDIQLTNNSEGRKQKNQLCFHISLESDQLRRLGSDLKWLQVKDNHITVNDALVKKITAGNPKMYYQLAQQIKKNMPRRSMASLSRESDDERDKEMHSES